LFFEIGYFLTYNPDLQLYFADISPKHIDLIYKLDAPKILKKNKNKKILHFFAQESALISLVIDLTQKHMKI